MKSAKITQVKRGEYIKRKPDAKKTYIRGAYCRAAKAYACLDSQDINGGIFIKSNTIVFVDFTF